MSISAGTVAVFALGIEKQTGDEPGIQNLASRETNLGPPRATLHTLEEPMLWPLVGSQPLSFSISSPTCRQHTRLVVLISAGLS